MTPADSRSMHRLGIAFMAVAAITFPVKDSFLKAQNESVPALLAIAIYFLAQMAIGMGGLAVSHHPAWRNPFAGMTGLHLLRSLTLTCALGTFFFSLRHVPLATAVTLYTLQGLFCIGFGWWLLRERILLRHIILVMIATAGVMMVVRPEVSDGSLGLRLLPLLSGALGGLYIVVTRKLAGDQSAFQLVCQDGAVASVTIFLIFIGLHMLAGGPGLPLAVDLGTICGPPVIAAAIGMISSLAMIRAAQLAPAAKLAPASYLEIASGALIGIVVFDEFLDWLTLGGILIIVAVCLTNTLLNEMDANKQS